MRYPVLSPNDDPPARNSAEGDGKEEDLSAAHVQTIVMASADGNLKCRGPGLEAN